MVNSVLLQIPDESPHSHGICFSPEVVLPVLVIYDRRNNYVGNYNILAAGRLIAIH